MSNKDASPAPGLPRALVQVFTFAASVAAIVVLAYFLHFALYLHRPLSPQPDAWGQFGDYFGGVLNPVIALGALLLLAVGVRIQNDTLGEAKKQLELQRAELEQTRAVLSQQSDQLTLQAEAAQRQVFETTFFRLVEFLRRLVTEFGTTPLGTSATFEWAIQLRDHGGGQLRKEELTPDDASKIVASWYTSHSHRLASYFALVLMTLEFVEKNEPRDAIFYTDILCATFTPGELFLLFHHGVGEGGNARFKLLAEKYGVLDSFDPEAFELSGGRRRWYAASRIARDYRARIK